MSVLHVLEVEILVTLGVLATAYGTISLALWWLSRDSERRQRERAARDSTDSPGQN